MGALKPKALLVFFLIQGLFLGGLVVLHLDFSLPRVTLEGVDAIVLPGESVTLTCVARIDRPGLDAAQSADLPVSFLRSGTKLGTSRTNADGIASLDFTASDRLFEQVRIDLVLDIEEEFSYHRGKPTLFLESISPGINLILCDVAATLEAAWEDVDPRRVQDWRADQAAIRKLNELAGGTVQRIVYVAPGSELRTAEVREYLRRWQFPGAPVLFPEFGAERPPLAGYIADLKKRWPRIKLGVSRRPALVSALAGAGVPVAVVKTPRGEITAGAGIRFVESWASLE